MKYGPRYFIWMGLLTFPVLFPKAQHLAHHEKKHASLPVVRLVPSGKFIFRSFVDCNMASVWIGDSFRIFPGKYGEDPLWGESHELKYASGNTVDEVFSRAPAEFQEPLMPANAAPGKKGLHGAVWFESLYQYKADRTGNTLYALYHNENYPSTLPYDPVTGEGYIDKNWPEGLRGPETKTAVCRIGIMKSVDGGKSWTDKGILLEDLQPRLILRPHNTGINFAGGVGDPSAIAQGNYLYVFYGEYGYPGRYDEKTYDPVKEWMGQCISIARIPLSELDSPSGNAKRWDGYAFSTLPDRDGRPVARLQIPLNQGGGPASSPHARYYWGPSVSWNEHLRCWVMLMARAEGPSWKGNSIYISYNRHADLGAGTHSQDWSVPQLLLKKPGHTLWYPSLQPLNTVADRKAGYTSLELGRKARLFYKDMTPEKGEYVSEYLLEFE
ncbi:MAG TPA: hypothetical protein DIC22_09260 [Chitinophagaceae bacterium]|jgi:hypothetical protein|nr:hypothetical protein [Chitinophagaceae bacterium]